MLKKLLVLIVTAFVDMVGLLMVIPLMPYYARDLGAGSLMVTVMVVSFTAAQLLSAPLWGRFSDKYGRRPALLVGLGAAAIAYVVFAYANSIWLLLLSRVVQGAGGGTVGVIQAYVADSTEPENRAKALGWLSAATNLGVALGPPLGSVALLMGCRTGRCCGCALRRQHDIRLEISPGIARHGRCEGCDSKAWRVPRSDHAGDYACKGSSTAAHLDIRDCNGIVLGDHCDSSALPCRPVWDRGEEGVDLLHLHWNHIGHHARRLSR
jgi:hypothetical protein